MLGLSYEAFNPADMVRGQSCDITGCDGGVKMTLINSFDWDGMPAGVGQSASIDPVVETTGYATDPIMTLSTGVPQIAQDTSATSGMSLYDLIGRALQVYQLDRQQRAFLETNRELILQGRQPLSWDQFQPTASVGVSLDSGTKKLIVGLGVGALALGLLSVMRR